MKPWLIKLITALLIWLAVMAGAICFITLTRGVQFPETWKDIALFTLILIPVFVASDYLLQKMRYPRDDD